MIPIPAKADLVYEDFYFTSADGTLLHGWYLPHQTDAEVRRDAKTILFLHGNAQNISNHVAGVYWLPKLGYDVYLFDYRGYGLSKGYSDLPGIMQDIGAAIDYVAGRLVEDNFVVLGHSLGASMGIYAVSQSVYKNRISAYIAVSAFGDYRLATRDFLSKHWLTSIFQWPLSFTINNQYRALDYVAAMYPVPVYIMHGLGDDIVQHYHSYEIYTAARQPKSLTILKAKHNDVFASSENRASLLYYLNKARIKTDY